MDDGKGGTLKPLGYPRTVTVYWKTGISINATPPTEIHDVLEVFEWNGFYCVRQGKGLTRVKMDAIASTLEIEQDELIEGQWEKNKR